MNIVGESIYAGLTANAAFAAIAGTRVYPSVRPQASTFPLVVYSVISDVPENAFGGPAETRLSHARVQIDCYAKTYLQAQQLAQAVDAVIGNWSAHDLSAVRSTTRDLYDDEVQAFRVSADYIVSR